MNELGQVHKQGTLAELIGRADIPMDIRTEAHRLSRHYPSDTNLSMSAGVIPSLWAIAAKDIVEMQLYFH